MTYRPAQQQMNDLFSFGMSLMFMGIMFGLLKSLVTSTMRPERKFLPMTETRKPPVTVTCPVCGKVIEVPEYNSMTRTEALRRHIEREHPSPKTVKGFKVIERGICPYCGKGYAKGEYIARWDYFRGPKHIRGRGVHIECYRRLESDYPPESPEFRPQVLIEGGEPVPSRYRYLVGWVREPLPEYNLAVELLPAAEIVTWERKIDVVLKQLKDGVESIQQSDRFRLFLGAMARFHDYSIGNLILIAIQKPDATRVAGFNTWKELGRWVKKGEKGISILAPVLPLRPTCPQCGARIPRGARFCPECGAEVERVEVEAAPAYFKVVYVFDLQQTEGKELPEFEVPVLTGEANEDLFAKVIALAKAQRLEVSFEPRPYQDPSIKGQYSGKSIWVKPDEPRAQQLKTLLHEVAHYYSEGVFQIPRRDAETIAESAAFAIGAHFGFDTGVRSFPYVALWAQDKKVLEQNLGNIRRVVSTILEELEKTGGTEQSSHLLPATTGASSFLGQSGRGALR